MSRAIVGGALANAAALVCLVVAYLRRDHVAVEGVYFNQSVGASDHQLTVASGNSSWLIAAGVLVFVGTSTLIWASTKRH